jgi:hypothetical protein
VLGGGGGDVSPPVCGLGTPYLSPHLSLCVVKWVLVCCCCFAWVGVCLRGEVKGEGGMQCFPVLTMRVYHALFMHEFCAVICCAVLCCAPCSRSELAEFGEPDFVIYNGGAFPANKVRVCVPVPKLCTSIDSTTKL